MDEDLVEQARKALSKEPSEAEIPFHIMYESIPCICRCIKGTDDEKTPPAPVHTPGIFERIKRFFQQS